MRRGLGVTKSLSESTEARGRCLETRGGRETGFQKNKNKPQRKNIKDGGTACGKPREGLPLIPAEGFLADRASSSSTPSMPLV